MRQLSVWRVPVPDGEPPEHVVDRLRVALNRATALDIHLCHSTVLHDDQYVLIQIEYDGMGHRDRWWIQRRAKYAMVAVCVRAKVKARTLELVRQETLPNKQSLRKPARHPNAGARTVAQRVELWRQFREQSQETPVGPPGTGDPTR